MSENKEEKKNQIIENNKSFFKRESTELVRSIKQALRKKRISVIKPKEDQILDFLKEDLDEDRKSVQSPKLLLYFLKTTPVFKQYIYINRFTNESLIASFRLGKYVRLKKGTILFKQGDKTDLFYLVLSGCIGFILTTYEDNILKKNPFSREVNSIKVGAYFGEWGLIYRINRTVSAYAKENSLLLGFDKKTFKTYYQNNIIFSENNSKKFVLKHIKTFKEINEVSFNQYYREIKKIYCIPGQEIFHEGDKADSFYLVYMGSCSVKKGVTNIIIKDSGDFIGIESLYSDEYETTIYPYNEGTVLFKFLLNSISQTIITNLKNEFSDYYRTQRKILKLSIENYHKYKDKFQMSFLNLIENIRQNKIKNNINGNNVNVSELNIAQDSKIKDKFSTPCKISKVFNLNKFSNKIININNDNRILSAKNEVGKTKILNEEFPSLKNYKSQNESPKNIINSNYNTDKSNSYIKSQKDKSQSSIHKKNKNIKENIKLKSNNFNNRKIRPYSSLHKSKNKKMDKDKYSFLLNNDKFSLFFNETKTDNLISLRKKDKNYNSNNSNKPYPKKNIIKLKARKNLINNYLFPLSSKHSLKRTNSLKKGNEKIKKNFPLKDKSSLEKSKKSFSKSKNKIHIFEKYGQLNNYSCSNNADYQIPLMIIRNVSFYNPLK